MATVSLQSPEWLNQSQYTVTRLLNEACEQSWHEKELLGKDFHLLHSQDHNQELWESARLNKMEALKISNARGWRWGKKVMIMDLGN